MVGSYRAAVNESSFRVVPRDVLQQTPGYHASQRCRALQVHRWQHQSRAAWAG